MITIKSDKEDIKLEAFESVTEFLKVTKEREENEAFKEKYYKASKIEGRKAKRFTGTENYEEAEELLTSGYKKGMKDLLSAKTNINVKTKTEAPKRSPYFYGSSLCISNFLTGQPKSMYRRQIVTQKQKVITINYDICVSYTFDKEDLFKAGKNIMSLITYFENKGVKVALNVCMYPVRDRYDYKEGIRGVSIKVKDFKQKLNPLLISYPLTHPSFLRRHIFEWIEKSPLTNEEFFTEGYGVPANVLYSDIKDLQERLKAGRALGKEGYYINPYMAYKAESIEDILKALGVQ